MRQIQFRFKLITLILAVLASNICYASDNPALAAKPAPINFKLQAGDLLFQDLNCGSFCDGIDGVTSGYQNSYISHIAMVIKTESKPEVIEAVSQGVVITPLSEFLGRSLDQNKQPRVMVGRVKANYQKLIPAAIKLARTELGKPYNASFIPAKAQAFYCSELIEYLFYKANHNQAVFNQQAMNFAAPGTTKILPLWQNYYAKIKMAVPQGVLGSNPGEISRESSVAIVYQYGQLRRQESTGSSKN